MMTTSQPSPSVTARAPSEGPRSNGARPAEGERAAAPEQPDAGRGTVVCLPTYDERENVVPMLHALAEVLDTTRDRVLVVDDASPDGTGDAAESVAAELPWVAVIHHGRKRGLGPAYLAGFDRALAEGAELIVTMDCDFSHDPRDVPRLVAAATDADLVIGSRYVAGGGTEPRTLSRKVLSRGGCLYARTVLGVGVRDLTAGFRCFRRGALERLPLDDVSAQGYAFHVELTYRAMRAGLAIREVPIRFGPRRAGVSKMSGAIAAEAAWRVPLLRARALAGRL